MAVNFPRKYTKVQSMTPSQRTPLPRPYYVSYKDTTEHEPSPGWYWNADLTGRDSPQTVYGPYLSHTEAMRDIQERT